MYIISSKKHAEKKPSQRDMPSPAFNIHNLETLQVVVESAAQLRSPVMRWREHPVHIVMVAGSLISLVQSLAREYNLPLVLHLDHHEESDDILTRFAQDPFCHD